MGSLKMFFFTLIGLALGATIDADRKVEQIEPRLTESMANVPRGGSGAFCTSAGVWTQSFWGAWHQNGHTEWCCTHNYAEYMIWTCNEGWNIWCIRLLACPYADVVAVDPVEDWEEAVDDWVEAVEDWEQPAEDLEDDAWIQHTENPQEELNPGLLAVIIVMPILFCCGVFCCVCYCCSCCCGKKTEQAQNVTVNMAPPPPVQAPQQIVINNNMNAAPAGPVVTPMW